MSATKFIAASLLGVIAGCKSPSWSKVARTLRVPSANYTDFCATDVTQSVPATTISAKPDDRSGPATAAIQPVAFNRPPTPEAIEAPRPSETSSQESGPLTLAQLEEIALVSNPALVEAQSRVDAARGRWIQAGLPPNTVIGYSGQQLGSHGQAEQNGVYLGQEVVRGGKLGLSQAVAEQEIIIAERKWDTQRTKVLTDVRLAYYEVLVAQRRLDVVQQLVEISTAASKVADALLRAKEVSQADVLRSRIELQTNEVAHKIARNQSAAAWSKLTTVLGTPDMPSQSLEGDLSNPTLDLSQTDALERVLAESPELHAALFNIDRSRWAIARARAEGVPNLDIQAIVQWDNATGSNNGALQVTVPIPWRNYNQGGIREAEANLIAAEHAVGRLELNLQRRLATVFQRYANARDQVQDYSKPDGILENAKRSLELARAGYQAGEFSYLDLLTAQRTFAQTNLASIEAIGELWAAVVEIEGLLLKDSLSDAPGDEK